MIRNIILGTQLCHNAQKWKIVIHAVNIFNRKFVCKIVNNSDTHSSTSQNNDVFLQLLAKLIKRIHNYKRPPSYSASSNAVLELFSFKKLKRQYF